MGRLGFTIERK